MCTGAVAERAHNPGLDLAVGKSMSKPIWILQAASMGSGLGRKGRKSVCGSGKRVGVGLERENRERRKREKGSGRDAFQGKESVRDRTLLGHKEEALSALVNEVVFDGYLIGSPRSEIETWH